MTLNDKSQTFIDSFMFMTGVMSCLWQCHVSLCTPLQIKCYQVWLKPIFFFLVS